MKLIQRDNGAYQQIAVAIVNLLHENKILLIEMDEILERAKVIAHSSIVQKPDSYVTTTTDAKNDNNLDYKAD